MSNISELNVAGKSITLKQTSGYPWNGNTQIEIIPKSKTLFTLRLRIPGWVQNEVLPSDLYTFADDKKLNFNITVNGEQVEKTTKEGYLCIERVWEKGDMVELHFDMEPRIVKAHEKVVANKGRIAIERGPIVYCAEWPDNDYHIRSILMPEKPTFNVVAKDDLLGGIHVLQSKAQNLYYDAKGLLQTKEVMISMIPYYSWAHRGRGEMKVWLPQEVSAVQPLR